MKNTSWLLLTLIPCFSNAANDQCTTAKVLTQIRPGAAWSMQGDSMDKLNWLDTKQNKPRTSEVEKAKRACVNDTKTREALKGQARLEIKDSSVPVEKKVNDLILLLDLDK